MSGKKIISAVLSVAMAVSSFTMLTSAADGTTTSKGVTKTVTTLENTITTVQTSRSKSNTSGGSWFYIGEVETENLESASITIGTGSAGANVAASVSPYMADENGNISNGDYNTAFGKAPIMGYVNTTAERTEDVKTKLTSLTTNDTVYLYAWVNSAEVTVTVNSVNIKSETSDEDTILLNVDFNDQTATADKGKAEEVGTVTYEQVSGDNYAARLDGTSAYFKLTNSDDTPLLKGKKEITVSMRTKNETHNINSWFFYAAPNSGTPNSRHLTYTGMYYDKNNVINYERWYDSSNNADEKISTTGSADWQNIDVVIAADHTDLYINNKLIGTKDYSGRSLKTILGDGDEQIFYIGKSAWNDTELFQGLIDDITVYGFAPSIDLGDLSAVTDDISLPTGKTGYEITWESSAPEVISSTGEVTQQEATMEVKLTATIKYGNRELEREYTATVLGTASYDITAGDSVTVSKEQASAGEQITATVTTPEGKVLTDIKVDDDSFFANKTDEGKFTFTMPSKNVNVTAVLEDKKKILSLTMDNKEETGITYSGDSEIVDGQKDKAVNFTGGYASLSTFPFREDFTFSAWINSSTLGTWERLFDFGVDTNKYIFLTLNKGDSTPRLAIKRNAIEGETIIDGTKAFSTDNWEYVTVTLDNGTVKIYVNGEEAGSGSVGMRMYEFKDCTNNYIAKSQYPRDPSFKGCVDEISIYNYALTEEEIKAEMNSTKQQIKSVEGVELSFKVGSVITLPESVNVTFANDLTSKAAVIWTTSEIPDGRTEGDYTVHGTANIYGEEREVTATVHITSDSKDANYSVGASINLVKNTGIAYADAIFGIAAKETAGDDDLVITAGAYDKHDALIGKEAQKTITANEVKALNGDIAGLRLPINASGQIIIKTALKKGESIVAECERAVTVETTYADTSEIKLTTDSRLAESERVGLGYIMGIDLPRLVAPSYEVHGLTLKYTATDDAVLNGDKAVGDTVNRYGGWEAKGAWKKGAQQIYTLAGEQMGHWLSAAAVFYNDLKNEESIELTAASLNGNDTSDTAPKAKNDKTVTPKDLHDKMEYVIDKLDELQNTDIPAGWTATKNKEYIGGCDETPFLNCFAGQSDWCGRYWVPWYNVHKVYQGLLDVYDYAEPELAFKAYNVLKKLSDWAATGTAGLTDAQMQSVLNVEYGGINEVFARMYEITGDEVYKTTARRFTHDSIIDPLKTDNTNSLDGKHANTQIPKFIGAAELYEQDTETYSAYRTACENFWKNVNYERCYAIGGNSLNEHFQTHGTEELGVKTCESCNTYNMMRLTEHLFSWEHKSEYMDWYERALYNHVLGQQDPETGAKMYFVSMVQGTHRIYEQKYNAWWCCTGTGMENPGRYTRVTYFEDNDDLYVNLYMPSVYTWESKDLTFNVDTNYPYEETIKITVTGKEKTGNLKLRAPGWLKNQDKQMTVKVNSEQKAVSSGGEYITLIGVKNGDVIELALPMGVSIYESRDNAKIAYEYGPMVLAAKLGGTVKPSYEFIWEERNTACQQVAYPILKTSDGKGKSTTDDITKYISKTGKDGTLNFTLAAANNSTGKDVELVPFIDIAHSYHNVYFDLDTEIDDYGINLSNVQLDYVDPDGQQSELGHGMIQSTEATTDFRSKSVQGLDTNGQYRYAYGNGGFFKYNMLVDKSAEKNYLILRYFDTDSSVTVNGKIYNVKFKIFADDTELVVDGGEFMEVKDGTGKTVDKLIEIPSSVVQASTQTDSSTGYNIISVKLVPYDDDSATVPYRRMYTTAGDPNNMGGDEPVDEKTLPETVEVSMSEDGSEISYTSEYDTDKYSYDMFTALYDSNNVLMNNKKNQASGSFTITDDGKYTVKVFFWNNMKPEYNPVIKTFERKTSQ